MKIPAAIQTATLEAGAERLANVRHEAFCQLYTGEALGNAAEAYRRAGYKLKSDDSARSEAARLQTFANVAARIAYLRRENERKNQITRGEALAILADIAKHGERTDQIRAIEALAKLCGWYTPEKVAHSGEAVIVHRLALSDIRPFKPQAGTAQTADRLPSAD